MKHVSNLKSTALLQALRWICWMKSITWEAHRAITISGMLQVVCCLFKSVSLRAYVPKYGGSARDNDERHDADDSVCSSYVSACFTRCWHALLDADMLYYMPQTTACFRLLRPRRAMRRAFWPHWQWRPQKQGIDSVMYIIYMLHTYIYLYMYIDIYVYVYVHI